MSEPVIVIVGPTASGKTDLAIRVAKKVNGEIICADSRTVYIGMDIGTAKPSLAQREGIPHYGLDLLKPDQRFTAADFQAYAYAKIKEIHSRDKPAVIVGGTGLYVDAVVFNYEFGADRESHRRETFNEMTVEELQMYCKKNDISLPVNHKNKRHLIRAIEQNGINHKRKSAVPDNYTIVGISSHKDLLQKRIEVRSHNMFAHGVVEEAISLASVYGWNSEAMTGSVYRIVRAMINERLNKDEAMSRAVRSEMGLAKRQMTWFRRNPEIYWSENASELEDRCINFTQRFRS